MGLYSVIGIVASAYDGQLKRNAGTAFIWSKLNRFGFPLSEGAFGGNFVAQNSQPLATGSPLYAEGGAFLSREGGNSKIYTSDSPDSKKHPHSLVGGGERTMMGGNLGVGGLEKTWDNR